MAELTVNSTFDKAFPYGATSLAVGTVGALLSLAASSTAATVIAVAIAIFGSYAFFGVMLCYFDHRKDPEAFEDNVGKYMITAAGTGLADIISTVARLVLIKMIFGDRN